MLKLPLLTMPSSRLQPSLRVYWKYRSASSMRCVGDRRQRARPVRFGQAEGLEQQRAGNGQAFERGFAGDHGGRPRSVTHCRMAAWAGLASHVLYAWAANMRPRPEAALLRSALAQTVTPDHQQPKEYHHEQDLCRRRRAGPSRRFRPATAAGTDTPRIDQRQANQEQRIDNGIASGELTKREDVPPRIGSRAWSTRPKTKPRRMAS